MKSSFSYPSERRCCYISYQMHAFIAPVWFSDDNPHSDTSNRRASQRSSKRNNKLSLAEGYQTGVGSHLSGVHTHCIVKYSMPWRFRMTVQAVDMRVVDVLVCFKLCAQRCVRVCVCVGLAPRASARVVVGGSVVCPACLYWTLYNLRTIMATSCDPRTSVFSRR